MINFQKQHSKKWYIFEILRYIDVIDAYDGNFYFRTFHDLGKAKAEFIRTHARTNGHCTDADVKHLQRALQNSFLVSVFRHYNDIDFIEICFSIRTKRDWHYKDFWYRFNLDNIRKSKVIEIYNDVRLVVKTL